jgi:chromosome segregation ATPase
MAMRAKTKAVATTPKNNNDAKNTAPVVEQKKLGRPRKQPLTVEQEIVAIHNKIAKMNGRINSIEEMVLELQNVLEQQPDTIPNKTVEADEEEASEDRLDAIDANITEVKEMLHQLLDSIGEEDA